MAAPTPEYIYKVTTRQAFADRSGAPFAGMPIDLSDGFMHFSTAAQLRETLRRHFAGQADLLLLAVPLAKIVENIRWEPSRGGELFPHLYAPLDRDAVAWMETIDVAADGSVELPEAVE